MWFSIIQSRIWRDRGNIPSNIGNSVLIQNNQYITKNGISAIVWVTQYSDETPINLSSKVIKIVKSKVKNVTIDYSVLATKYNVNMSNDGLNSRMLRWRNTLNNADKMHPAVVARDSTLLYTAQLLKGGKRAFTTYSYFTVRAESGTELNSAISEVVMALNTFNVQNKVIKSGMKRYISIFNLISQRRDKAMRDIRSTISTSETIADLMPATQSINEYRGIMIGIDMLNNQAYRIDNRESEAAKNFYWIGPSGHGKTFTLLNTLLDAVNQGEYAFACDIKGDEITRGAIVCGGAVISLRQDDTKFINTVRMKWDGKSDPSAYFNERFSITEAVLNSLINFPRPSMEDKDSIVDSTLATMADSFVSEMLNALYLDAGVLPDNPNTWERTDGMDMYYIGEFFNRYVSPQISQRYSTVIDTIRMRFAKYLYPHSPKGHIFRTALDYDELLEKRYIAVDFGIKTENRVTVDEAIFKVKVMYMKLVKDAYIRRNKSKGITTHVVLEESEIAKNWLLDIYAESIAINRSSGVVNHLVGNSYYSLATTTQGRVMLDNITVFIIGPTDDQTRKEIVKNHNIKQHEEQLRKIAEKKEYMHVFLVVNKMKMDATSTLIKAHVPSRVRGGTLYR